MRFRTFSPRAGHWFDDNGACIARARRVASRGRLARPSRTGSRTHVRPLDAAPRPLLRPRRPVPAASKPLSTNGAAAGGRLAHQENHHIGRLGEASARARRGGESWSPARARRASPPLGCRDHDKAWTRRRARTMPPGSARHLDRCGLRLGATAGGAGRGRGGIGRADHRCRFFDRLRDLLGRICLVFSSREAPDDVFASNNKASPITNRMETAVVGLLEAGGDDGHPPRSGATRARRCRPDASLVRSALLFSAVVRLVAGGGCEPRQCSGGLSATSGDALRQMWKAMPVEWRIPLRDAARGCLRRWECCGNAGC